MCIRGCSIQVPPVMSTGVVCAPRITIPVLGLTWKASERMRRPWYYGAGWTGNAFQGRSS
eukprot:8361604-Alexandrium_andersonii.AAC.1